MLRQKSTLLASLILCLSMAMVLGNVPLLQTSLTSVAFGQVRTDTEDDPDDPVEQLPGITGNAAGVVINAEGILSLKRSTDKSKSLWRARQKQAVARVKADNASSSKLRKVSLTRLERMAADQLKSGQPLPEDMLYLAGLTKIQYIFAYPDTGDVVIAGPAEPIMVDDLGRPRGAKSGRAMLELQDLVVALRAFGPDGSKTNHIGVSIDPTQEGLARMQKFLSNVGRNINNRGQTKNIVRGLTKSLGQQVVTVRGISPNTHYAQVLVEADYRMKLIGIGLETPPVDITTYVEKANPGTVSRNALARWYFVPNYESVRMSEDGLAAELVGEGVKLIGANEMVQQDGSRVSAKGGDRASKVFTQSFTKLYSKLAVQSPVYAQLRNVIDMTIAAATIQQNDMYGQTAWQMELFADESQFPVEVFETPKTVSTAVNAIWRGNQLMTPVGGGVSIRPLEALSSENLIEDDGRVQQTRDTVSLKQLPDSAWWWD